MQQEQTTPEIWITIPGFENYQASNLGRIRRHTPGVNAIPEKEKKIQTNSVTGYSHIKISGSAGRKSISLHRIIAELFVPRVDGKEEVDHIDRDKSNNKAENLRWSTRSENMKNSDPSFHRRPITVFHLDGTTSDFPSIKSAGEALGIHPSAISNVLANKTRAYKGIKFQYI